MPRVVSAPDFSRGEGGLQATRNAESTPAGFSLSPRLQSGEGGLQAARNAEFTPAGFSPGPSTCPLIKGRPRLKTCVRVPHRLKYKTRVFLPLAQACKSEL